MMKPLPTYLRTHRRSWAMTQRECARLLGIRSDRHISRLEHGQCQPSLHILFATEIIFGAHPKDVFVQAYDSIEEKVIQRVYQLQQELEGDQSERAKRKRQLVSEALSRAVIRSKISPRP